MQESRKKRKRRRLSEPRGMRARGAGVLLRSVLAICAVLAPEQPGWSAGEQSDAASEYQVKAAFLFHFAQFVDWPAEAFKQADSPIVYCTLGDDPFRGALDASLNGKMLGARRLLTRHLRKVSEAPGCQVLFIGAEEQKSISAAEASAQSNAMLTVGETEHFAADGGMIGFCLEENKIRFEINVAAAERAKLKISARLLALAKTVIGRPKEN